ncbi:MAG: phosphomannomutase [Thermoanaerobaculia bacterium]|jgi:hypothetical protein|nr:phosphomannomutase [Thermoanaerobaculia bacterium]
MSLIDNIQRNLFLRDASQGCSRVIIVAGNERDSRYWQSAFTTSRRDVFRSDGQVLIDAVTEQGRKGNFLGAIDAWTKSDCGARRTSDSVVLMNMVFGKGKRLSPFTQALGDRKPAFPTPRYGRAAGRYLTSAELASLYSNSFAHLLGSAGFSGALLKWGDEILVPNRNLAADAAQLRDCDAVRFTWRTNINDDLANQKEWLVFDRTSLLLEAELCRQPKETLQSRLAKLSTGNSVVGVNLGSLAISDTMLKEASSIFASDLADHSRWIDWDPYVWIALLSRSRAEWESEKQLEAGRGSRGITELEARVPQFFEKCTEWRHAVETARNRPLRIVTVDFGEPLWVDFGLHGSLYAAFNSLGGNSEESHCLRELFGMPHQRDMHGNIVVHSSIPANAQVHGSVIVGSSVRDSASIIESSFVMSTTARILEVIDGGVCIESAGDELRIRGPNAVAFRSIGRALNVGPGQRHSTIIVDGKLIDLRLSELLDSDRAYEDRVEGNVLSFQEASVLMQNCQWSEYEALRATLSAALLS